MLLCREVARVASSTTILYSVRLVAINSWCRSTFFHDYLCRCSEYKTQESKSYLTGTKSYFSIKDLRALHEMCVLISYLRATPTAAGPSSSKRSVLWRTRGFAALGFDCCVVVGAVSGACFLWDHMILKVCVCNILLNYASRSDFKCVGKSVKTGPQIVPKHFQN